MTGTCIVCGKPAPWLFKAKVPLCSEHYHERRNGLIFIVEVKNKTDMLKLLESYCPESFTGKLAKVPREQLERMLGFSSMENNAIVFIEKKNFNTIINSIYHD